LQLAKVKRQRELQFPVANESKSNVAAELRATIGPCLYNKICNKQVQKSSISLPHPISELLCRHFLLCGFLLFLLAGLYLPQLCKSPRMISRRSMVDPIKLAKEHAQYMSSLHLSSLRNGGVISPNSFRGESGEGFGRVIGVSAPQPSPDPTDVPTYDQAGNSQPINIAGSPTAAPARTPSGQWSRSHANSLQPGAPVGSPDIQPGSMIIPAPSPSPSTTEADTYAPSPVLVEAVTPTSEYLPVFAADSEDQLDDKDLMYESYFI
jgi:hypothetical protein